LISPVGGARDNERFVVQASSLASGLGGGVAARAHARRACRGHHVLQHILGSTSVPNPAACENSLPGDPPSDWQVAGSGNASIQGFATSMSVNAGGAISFKIDTPSTAYHIFNLRLGYYGGDGARMIAAGLDAAAEPAGVPDRFHDGPDRL
jgi:hypothetical protein